MAAETADDLGENQPHRVWLFVPPARVSAAIALLDRGFGKATQPVESDVNLVNYGISAVPITSEEWQAQFCTEEIKGEFSH
jgi:hypothetical protein